MFQLTWEETRILRSQFVTLDGDASHFRYRPLAFTEQGVAMLSAVLQSPRAVAVSVEIVRVFVRLRKLLDSHDSLARGKERDRQNLMDLQQMAHTEKCAIVRSVTVG